MLETKDIKKGNLVECLEDYGEQFTKGKIYEIRDEKLSSWGNVIISKDDLGSRQNGLTRSYFKLHKRKEDLRELLQVGYKIVYCDGLEAVYKKTHNIYLYVDENFDNDNENESIKEIYKPKYNGIKPMEWVLVWKREEERFTLRLAGNVRLPYYAHGNCKTRYDYTFRKSSKSVNEEKYQVAFTREEIKKLPNQELINGLIKEPVKNETV